MSCLSHEQFESLRAKARKKCRPSRRKLHADHHFRKPSDKPPFRQSSVQVAYWQQAEAFSRQKNLREVANRLLPGASIGVNVETLIRRAVVFLNHSGMTPGRHWKESTDARPPRRAPGIAPVARRTAVG